MGCLEGSGTPVLYIGRTVPKDLTLIPQLKSVPAISSAYNQHKAVLHYNLFSTNFGLHKLHYLLKSYQELNDSRHSTPFINLKRHYCVHRGLTRAA